MISIKPTVCAITLAVATCWAQSPPHTTPTSGSQKEATPAAPDAAPVPLITQIRKSVTFIKLSCREGAQQFDVRGTGFFVFYPDPRLGKDGGFVYLVTNRHVALCWNELGQPLQVQNISVTMNRKQAVDNNLAQEAFLNHFGNVPWIVPQDGSVDLAVLPLAPDQALFDYRPLPISIFISDDLLKHQQIAEGDSVLFAGFFYQFPGRRRMEPIIRQGYIAMIPEEKVPFLGAAEKVYLADLHAFGGNSGSPVFVNLAGFHNGSLTVGLDYRLLGVINAEVTEDENFNLELTTTMRGKAAANSGVSTIVPADELRALLEDPKLQRLRNEAVKVTPLTHP